ncbi:hypothetical protein [Moorella sulfitireducens (nom. illeg.)]|uniref:hypothetical protein n=1 Tax=Neomoorella sulfitireducens TaxID=2972948 RepID=UPI0021AC7ED5|nr:hypothetical protein [Moorella sulfitireducens]
MRRLHLAWTARDKQEAGRQAWLLTAAAVALLFYLGWQYLIGPPYKSLQATRAAVVATRLQVEEYRSRLQKETMAVPPADLNSQVAAMDAYFGREPGWDILVDELAAAIAASDLRIFQASFGAEEMATTYSTRKASFVLEGSGSAALELLRRLEDFPRLVRVDGVILDFGPATAQQLQLSLFRWTGAARAKEVRTGAGTATPGGNAH